MGGLLVNHEKESTEIVRRASERACEVAQAWREANEKGQQEHEAKQAAVRNAINDYLAAHPAVKDFYPVV